MNLIADAHLLVDGADLMGQMLMRLAMVDALLVIGRWRLLVWVLTHTYSWARFVVQNVLRQGVPSRALQVLGCNWARR